MIKSAATPVIGPLLILAGALAAPLTSLADPVPAAAAQAGYTTETFHSTFAKGVQFGTPQTGSEDEWYPYRLFNAKPDVSKIRIEPDHTLTLLGDTTGPNGEICSISPGKTPGDFVGRAFGGGAYFEATFKFDPDDITKSKSPKHGWPAFWGMAVEHFTNSGDKWKGEDPRYLHFIETDFFEYDMLGYGQPKNMYGAALRDWYGIYKVTCPDFVCNITTPNVKRVVPTDVDWKKYHRIGFLWIPATPTRQGTGSFFFDDTKVGDDEHWNPFGTHKPGDPKDSWKFSVLDKQHIAVVLGTGPGKPMNVKSVSVWQASDRENLTH